MANARLAAMRVLLQIEREGAYSGIALNNEIKTSELPANDCALASTLVYGVLEKKLTIDYVIAQYSKIPLNKINIQTLTILRMAIYQMVFMDKIPSSAAVNEAVKLAKKYKLFNSTGFVNGLLRTFARNDFKFSYPKKNKDNYHYNEVFYSCPRNIIRIFEQSYGKENSLKILEALTIRPYTSLRVNTLKTTTEELKQSFEKQNISVFKVPFVENALSLKNSGSIESMPQFKDGLFHIQDVSSQLCCSMLSPKPEDVLADVCSAPGGKAFTLSQIMENKGAVYAFDIYDHKVKLIEDGANRLGISIIKASQRDASKGTEIPLCDRILCDVPCSGLGIIRRKPEIRYKSDLGTDTLPDLQYEILVQSSKHLKAGGMLVYSTCTLNQKENGEVVNRFLNENKGFKPVKVELPTGLNREINEPENQLTIFPKAEMDGFFISLFVKTE